jgi:hypothetical protein
MAGVRQRFDSEGEMCLAALLAGVDLLLDVADPVGVVAALEEAVKTGRLLEKRVEEALGRIDALKRRVAERPPAPPVEGASPAAEALADRIALEATRVVSGAAALPLDMKSSLTCLLLKPHHRPTDPPEQPLAVALRERFAAVRYFEAGPDIDPQLAEDLLAGAPEGRPVLVAMIVKPAAWHAFGLTPQQDALVQRLMKQRPVVLACLGVEGALDHYTDAAARVVTHSDVPASQRALAQRLAGP